MASEVSYRLCDRHGWSKFDTLDKLDAYLERLVADGNVFTPIKRIVKVESTEVPLTDTALRFNEAFNQRNKRRGLS